MEGRRIASRGRRQRHVQGESYAETGTAAGCLAQPATRVERWLKARLRGVDAEPRKEQRITGCAPCRCRRVEQPISGAECLQDLEGAVEPTAEQYVSARHRGRNQRIGPGLLPPMQSAKLVHSGGLQNGAEGCLHPPGARKIGERQMLPAIHRGDQIVVAEGIHREQGRIAVRQASAAKTLGQRARRGGDHDQRHGIRRSAHGLTRSRIRRVAKPHGRERIRSCSCVLIRKDPVRFRTRTAGGLWLGVNAQPASATNARANENAARKS